MADPVASTRIGVHHLMVMADIGLNAHEIGLRQPLVIAVTIWIDPVACDGIDATIDYRAIVDAAEMLAGQRIALIETFAHRLATACLAFSGARRADVTIDKPQALPAGTASVTLTLAHPDKERADKERADKERADKEEDRHGHR